MIVIFEDEIFRANLKIRASLIFMIILSIDKILMIDIYTIRYRFHEFFLFNL